MTALLAEILDRVEKNDVIVLYSIERNLTRYKYVPLEVIERVSRLPPSSIQKSIKRLTELKLVRRRLGNFSGYTLTYRGLDVLALNSLLRRGYITRLGDKIGVGKESDIYIAESPRGLIVVKLHREGRTSFSKVRRVRSYAQEIEGEDWIRVVKTIGEREFKALVELRSNKALVPEPVTYNRHAVVQEYIRGVDLYKVEDLDEETARATLADVIETLRIAYTKVGIVHGDLSQYNVLISEDGRGYVIDWPQYVYKGEESSGELLFRDVKYITSYYERKFGVSVDAGRVLKYVKGEINEKPL